MLHAGCRDFSCLDAAAAGEESLALAWHPEEQERLQSLGAAWPVRLLDELEEVEGPFDFVILSDVLGKVPDVQEFLTAIRRLTTHRTRLLITNHTRHQIRVITTAAKNINGRLILLKI